MTSIWNVVQEVGVDVMEKKLEPVESYCVAVGISGDKKLSYNGFCPIFCDLYEKYKESRCGESC